MLHLTLKSPEKFTFASSFIFGADAFAVIETHSVLVPFIEIVRHTDATGIADEQ